MWQWWQPIPATPWRRLGRLSGWSQHLSWRYLYQEMQAYTMNSEVIYVTILPMEGVIRWSGRQGWSSHQYSAFFKITKPWLSPCVAHSISNLAMLSRGFQRCAQRARSHFEVHTGEEGKGMMGRCANKTAQPRPSLSLRPQATSIRSITRLGLYHNSDIIFGGWGPKLPNLKLWAVVHFLTIQYMHSSNTYACTL